MNQSTEILNVLTSRNLDENLRDLVEISSNNNFRLLLIKHNSLMDDFFKGVLPKEVFDTEKAKIWESIFYFVPRLNSNELSGLLSKPYFAQANTSKKILYVASTPGNATPLQLGFEFERITTALGSGSQREAFELLQPLMAATLERFLIVKHKEKPAIIHFSGHGSNEGLYFSTERNEYKLITDEVLKEVFKSISNYALCVVLNACYASSQAEVLSKEGVYVIGMNAPIEDPAAVALSEKFYRGLSNGQNIEEAFFHTKTLLLSEFPQQASVPELWKNGKTLSN